MKKILIIIILIISITSICTNPIFAFPASKDIWTAGTETTALGQGEGWESGYLVFIEIRLYNNALEKIDEASNTDWEFVSTSTGTHEYNYNTCVTLGTAEAL